MDALRRQCQSKLDWLWTDIDCSRGWWHPKHAPEVEPECNTASQPPGIGTIQSDLEAQDFVGDCHFGGGDDEYISCSKTNSISSYDGCQNCDNEVSHNHFTFGKSDVAGGCVVILPHSGAQCMEEVHQDEFSDNDSIVDAAIKLASAENHCHLAEMEDNDDVHSLNLYVCFEDPR